MPPRGVFLEMKVNQCSELLFEVHLQRSVPSCHQGVSGSKGDFSWFDKLIKTRRSVFWVVRVEGLGHFRNSFKILDFPKMAATHTLIEMSSKKVAQPVVFCHFFAPCFMQFPNRTSLN